MISFIKLNEALCLKALHKFRSLQEKRRWVKGELDIYTREAYKSMKVTQAILPVEVNYTPMYERNTDKNVCTTTDPQKNSRGLKF
jgi:hypothetical protein